MHPRCIIRAQRCTGWAPPCRGQNGHFKGSKPEWILKAVSTEGCSIVWLLVPWAQDILDSIDRGDIDLKNYDLSRWRLMHIGAQPVPPSLVRRWKQHFPDHDYDTNYGLSESTGPGCVHLGIENIHKVGAIGKAGSGYQVRIVDPLGNDVPPGEVGELIVKGPGVMKCYYKDEQATAETLRDGWLFTGDMAQEGTASSTLSTEKGRYYNRRRKPLPCSDRILSALTARCATWRSSAFRTPGSVRSPRLS